MRPELVAAVDIGGTKIAGALVDDAGRLLARTQVPTPPNGTAGEVFAAVRTVTDRLRAHQDWGRVVRLGIGSAGPVDLAHGTVSPVNIPGWRGFPLAQAVAQATDGPAVRLVGDGAAFTAGEHWLGAARGVRNALGMVVSTGVGGGLVLDGALFPGRTGNAGHIGHTSVDLHGDLCPCGGRGCLEILASGTAIARYARQAGWRPEHPDGDATAVGVAAAAEAGNAVARAAFRRAARALAAAIAATTAMTEIEMAVIGGGVSRAGDTLFVPLRAELRRYATLPFAGQVRVEPARLGSDAGLLGAAAAWRDGPAPQGTASAEG